MAVRSINYKVASVENATTSTTTIKNTERYGRSYSPVSNLPHTTALAARSNAIRVGTGCSSLSWTSGQLHRRNRGPTSASRRRLKRLSGLSFYGGVLENLHEAAGLRCCPHCRNECRHDDSRARGCLFLCCASSIRQGSSAGDAPVNLESRLLNTI